MKHLKSIRFSLLPVLDITEFCSINSRLDLSTKFTIQGIQIRGTTKPSYWSPHPICCSRNILFKNSRTARWDGTTTCINYK